MRWALLSLALLLVVGGLLYRGGVAFVSTLSDAASLGADGPATVAATTGQVEAPTWPARADRMAASGMPRPETASGLQPDVPSDPEESAPDASEQRAFKSRRALETINPRDLVR
jgi:hypothetical protein